MNNKRIRQLAYMFSDMTGESYLNSRAIIMKTETGKAIAKKNMTVMYEQQTENMYSIAMELREIPRYKKLADKITISDIVKTMKKLKQLEKNKIYSDEPAIIVMPRTVKVGAGKKLSQEHRKMLEIKRQNKINARRIENANKIKEQR